MKKYINIFVYLLLIVQLHAQTKVTSTNLNLREEPNSYSKIITVIPKGTKVTLTEDCNCKWISVAYSGFVGYINSGYLKKVKEQNIGISQKNEGYYTVTNNLNVRSYPSTKSSVLGQFAKDQVIYVDGFDNGWASVRVQINNNIRSAYVHSNYLRLSTNAKTNVQNLKSQKNNTGGDVKYYVNTYGEKVQSPTYYDAPPPGATALCRDGTYSFSRNRKGTCSHHGGVAKWL